MKVDYVLSWEEFMEVHDGALPKPPIGSFICTVLIALATGTFGGLLVYFIQPQDRMVASVFCWVSLALFIAAFWDLKFRTNKRRERFAHELRSIYDRHYDGKQSFTFDSDNWTHETKAGKYEASWSALRTAVERPNVIHWSTRDHIVLLPKRVMSDGAMSDKEGVLARLRRFTLGPQNSGLSFRLAIADYVLTEVPLLWRRHPFLMAEAHLGGLLWVLMVAYGMYDSVGPGVIYGWIIAGLLLFLTITTQFWYFVTKYFTAPAGLREDWESEFSDRGVRARNSEIESFVSWMAFRKFSEAPRAFLLYFDSNNYHIYPKRCLSPDRRESLRNLLKTSVVADS
jgi:hypothetical protein